jgi:UDP-N-acetylmuramate dehydrogenase
MTSPISLFNRLPPVRGELIADASLAPFTWFRVGGPADILFQPADLADLIDFLTQKPADIPVTVIGVGSNLLVRDGGVRGVVIRLGRALSAITAIGEGQIKVGAGAIDVTVSAFARDSGLKGLEFLTGVPGTIGGALRMNAGAYGGDMLSITRQATLLDSTGGLHQLSAAQLGFSYRHCDVAEDWIFIEAILRGEPDAPAAIAERMAAIRAAREDSQPLRTRTGGSTFANPIGEHAWQLIDRAGCRGLTRGGAKVSDKHCNFLINQGGASALDIEALGEEVRARVLAATGVELRWEIRRIGEQVKGQGHE